ncbi:hypothetical protein [Halovivax asiaticus]|uniref:hypothetical protein n=1 Tax=Halovivax asiaticus TaxID=332953 RepID=UPI001375C144|nr:hypothetical protein [Halovivax asiaticus]
MNDFEPQQCELGGCTNPATQISPEGHVCSSCAASIGVDYRRAERRERRALR